MNIPVENVKLNVMNSHNYHNKILIWVVVHDRLVSLVFTLSWAGGRIAFICASCL